jgi:hypothetical protein
VHHPSLACVAEAAPIAGQTAHSERRHGDQAQGGKIGFSVRPWAPVFDNREGGAMMSVAIENLMGLLVRRVTREEFIKAMGLSKAEGRRIMLTAAIDKAGKFDELQAEVIRQTDIAHGTAVKVVAKRHGIEEPDSKRTALAYACIAAPSAANLERSL